MVERLRIGVMGAGSIGCYVGGKLLARGETDVVLIGRDRLRSDIAANGLTVKDLDHASAVVPAERVDFATEPAALADCAVVLCCVKSAQTRLVAESLSEVLAPDAVVVSLQNGLRNADELRAELGEREVLGGIVGFNAISLTNAVFRRTMSGPITLEQSNAPAARALIVALGRAGLEVQERADLAPDQWAKLIVNLNNSISALSGAPTRDLLLTPGYRRVMAAVVEEGVGVVRAAGIRPARIRGLPPRLAPKMLRMPTFLIRLFARAQLQVDAEARSSMYEDLARGRLTEVDYLNGEIVELAERNGLDAPVNRRIVELVHEAEAAGPGSPNLSPAQLWAGIQR